MQGRATISNENQSSFPTNNTKFITAEFLRTFQELINSSKFNLVDDNLSNIQFSETNFSATNALEAVLELYTINAPLFYVDMNFSYFPPSNFGSGQILYSVTGSSNSSSGSGSTSVGIGTPLATINFSNINTQTGFSIRGEEYIHIPSLTDTSLRIIIPNFYGDESSSASTQRRYYFYPELT